MVGGEDKLRQSFVCVCQTSPDLVETPKTSFRIPLAASSENFLVSRRMQEQSRRGPPEIPQAFPEITESPQRLTLYLGILRPSLMTHKEPLSDNA